MLLIGLLARLHLRRLDGIAYLINLGPAESLHHAGLFYLDLYISDLRITE